MNKTDHYKGHRWTNDELKTLMQLWASDESLDIIASQLNCTQTALLKQIQRMRKNGIPLRRRRKGNNVGNYNKPWTQGEVEYLLRRRNEKATSEEIGIELDRTRNAVDAMIAKLRLEDVNVAMRGNGVRRLWDAESLKSILIQNVFD